MQSTSSAEPNEIGHQPVGDETDLFLDALLGPNEHMQRLVDIRARVVKLCLFSENLPSQHHLESTNAILRSVLLSFDLLKKAGLAENSLILLVDDPGRPAVVRAIDIDVGELRVLQKDCRNDKTLGQSVSKEKTYQAARKLLDMVRLESQIDATRKNRAWIYEDLDQVRAVQMFCALLVFATVSYAGSHCHSLGEDMSGLKANTEPLDIADGLKMRPCRFACLNQFIGAPVWVFGAGTARSDIFLSITKERFDDLWGPLVELRVVNSHYTIALQTTGGFLCRASSERSSNLANLEETEMHWVPTPRYGKSLPQVLPFDLSAPMLIGFDGQRKGSLLRSRGRSNPNCFEVNPDCNLDAKAYERSAEARQFEYIGTSNLQWKVDTKAVNVTAGWSGSSMGIARTYKLQPAKTWKEVMLMYCAQPERNIRPLMSLRVGLERSICTGNARRVSLLDALKLAFPEQHDLFTALATSVKTCKKLRKTFVNYINDLSQTGMDGKDLRLFWPSTEQTMHRIIRIDSKLPNWTEMLREGQATCCFAVAVDDCLVLSGDAHRLCHNSGHPRRGLTSPRAQKDLFSTTINLHENPTAKLPLAPGGILRLESGRLSISNKFREGRAQSAAFWVPGIIDKVKDKVRGLIATPGSQRPGARTHTELLDSRRGTGLWVDVCIVDR